MGVVLKKYRKEKNMSLDDLVELMGVSKFILGNIECGEINLILVIIWKILKGIFLLLLVLFKLEDFVSLYWVGEGLWFFND